MISESESILKKSSIRLTKQRINLLDKLMQANKPFSAYDVNEYLLQTNKVNLVTIYRFLTLLSEKHLIRMIGEFNGKQYYEFSNKGAQHPHFFCSKCNKIICLKYLSADDFILLSNYAPNVKTSEIKITLGGLCEECQKH